jgi:outer membrane protein assembly factor BamB
MQWRIALLVLLLLLPLVAEYRASSSPVYPQLGYNPGHTGLSPWKGPQMGIYLVFSVNLSSAGQKLYGKAVGADGTIYLESTDGIFYAINPDGTIKWSITSTVNGAIFVCCLPATPLIGSDGTIYFESPEGVYAVDPNGAIKWKLNPAGISISMLSAMTMGPDGTIYVGITYTSKVGASADHFYAINPNGMLKWEYDPGNGVDWVYYTAVDPSTGVIYFTTQSSGLYALNPDGTLKWRYPYMNNALQPVVGSDGTVYVGNYSYFYAFNPDGTIKWEFGPVTFYDSATNTTYPAIMREPVIGPDGTVYVATDCGWFYALKPDGTLKWRFEAEGAPHWLAYSGPAPVVGADGTIYVAFEKFLYALNPDGTIKWEWKDPSPVGGVAIYGNLLITQPHSPTGLLIFSDNSPTLYAIGGTQPQSTPNPKIFIALAPDYSLWALLLVAMCITGFAFASRGKMVLGISFIASAIAVYYVILKPFVSLQALITQAQQLISNAVAQIPLGPILPLIIAVAGIAVLIKVMKR